MAQLGPHMDNVERRAEFQLFLRQRGIRDRNVLRALEMIPRTLFVEEGLQEHAYADRALPIACGQTISQPYLVAYMTEQLEVANTHKVFEVGMGSGYQTAVLSRLARRVYTMDRYRTLIATAEQRLARLRITNVTSMPGDGALGWAAQAPFDRIIVTAAAEEVPKVLVQQLGPGGIMLIPVGAQNGDQTLLRIFKNEAGEVAEKALMPVRFVPLVSGRAASL